MPEFPRDENHLSGDEIDRIAVAGSRAVKNVLAHYGIKGMKWGVRKEEEIGPHSTASYLAALDPGKKVTAKEAAANLTENEKKFQDKFNGPDKKTNEAAKKSFVSKHKKVLINTAVGAAVIAGLILSEKQRNAKYNASIKEFSGKDIPLQQFESHVNFSKEKTWMKNDFVKPESFDREEFTLPAGHTFHRISRDAEDTFGESTYATHSTEDFNRYVAQFRGELGDSPLHHVTFQATQDVKVPNLQTVLSTLKEAMTGTHTYEYSEKQILDEYQSLSGGKWNGNNALKMIDRLKQKGYGALVDEMDAGVIGETPLVLFAQHLLGGKSNTLLTEEAISQAEASLIELSYRKAA